MDIHKPKIKTSIIGTLYKSGYFDRELKDKKPRKSRRKSKSRSRKKSRKQRKSRKPRKSRRRSKSRRPRKRSLLKKSRRRSNRNFGKIVSGNIPGESAFFTVEDKPNHKYIIKIYSSNNIQKNVNDLSRFRDLGAFMTIILTPEKVKIQYGNQNSWSSDLCGFSRYLMYNDNKNESEVIIKILESWVDPEYIKIIIRCEAEASSSPKTKPYEEEICDMNMWWQNLELDNNRPDIRTIKKAYRRLAFKISPR